MKWIILDAMGVVYKTGYDVEDLLIPYLKSKNNQLDSELIHDLYIQASAGHITSKEFWSKLGFMNEYPWIEQQYLANYLQVDEEVYNFLQLINYNTYRIAMLSNDVSEWSLWLRKHFKLEQWFSDCIISGDVKVRKPDPEIYQIALLRLQAQPADCVFVDDRLKNLRAAAGLGFRTILFDREHIGREAIAGSNINGYARSFTELMPLIQPVFEMY